MISRSCHFPSSLVLVATLVAAIGCRDGNPPSRIMKGSVVNEKGQPVAGARVRLGPGRDTTTTGERGNFEILDPRTRPLTLSVSKVGHFINRVSLADHPLNHPIIRLRSLPANDDSRYEWVDPTPHPSKGERCGNCHQEIYTEWSGSPHSRSARNRRFFSIYNGTNWEGDRRTGWNLRQEHPDGIGVCASCHAPGIDFEGGASDDMQDLTGTAAQGVHCDFCHKVRGLASHDFSQTHGRFAFDLLRSTEEPVFFGPLDDANGGDDAYSQLHTDSRFCASCHEGIVFGVPVYSTYSEWLSSPAKRRNQSCQSCHMSPTGQMRNVAPGAGGIERNPMTLASHRLLPSGRREMLQDCLQVAVQTFRQTTSVTCRVTVVAQGVGHRVPTGFVDRHLILAVEAFNSRGARMAPKAAPMLPPPVGPELANVAGWLFAKQLADESGHDSVPFWRASHVRQDTRLQPEHPEHFEFQFPESVHRLQVRVVYRRFWQSVTREKGWPDDTLEIYRNVVRP